LAENKEQAQTQALGQREIVTLNGKDYFVDSFPEKEKTALGQIVQIEQEMEIYKVRIRNNEYAKQYLVDYLVQNTKQFEEVPGQAQEAQEGKE
jgi:hypothetical protein